MIIQENTQKDILSYVGALEKISSNLRQLIADIKPEKPEKKLSDYTIDQLLAEVKNRVSKKVKPTKTVSVVNPQPGQVWNLRNPNINSDGDNILVLDNDKYTCICLLGQGTSAHLNKSWFDGSFGWVATLVSDNLSDFVDSRKIVNIHPTFEKYMVNSTWEEQKEKTTQSFGQLLAEYSQNEDDQDVLTLTEVSNPKNITLPTGIIHSSTVFDYFKHADGSVHTYDKNGHYVQHGSAFRVSNDSDGWKLIEKYKSMGEQFRYIYRCPRIAYKLARAGSCGVKKKYGKVVDVYYK